MQLTIRNPTSQLFAYKIKTTAPKQYCVKPNAGRIGANSSVPIQGNIMFLLSRSRNTPISKGLFSLVILQPLKEEPAADFKCKDKFLIQSIALTPETENVSLADLVSTRWTQPLDTMNIPCHVTRTHFL